MLLCEFGQSHHNSFVINQQIGEEFAKETANTSKRPEDNLDESREMNYIESMNFYRRDYICKGDWLARDELPLWGLSRTFWGEWRPPTNIIETRKHMID